MKTSYKVPGKWILAGEHSVLRGYPALVFPLSSCSMEVSFEDVQTPLQLKLSGPCGDELKLLAWGVLENAAQRLGKSLHGVQGVLEITSYLPVGAGLGASAALCVAIGKWCSFMGWLDSSELYELSRNLEDLFHGESSGVDVAVVLREKGLRFLRQGPSCEILPRWQPQLYLSYSGHRGMTSECVGSVRALLERDPSLGKTLDAQMAEAVDLAEQALTAVSKAQGLQLLARAMNLAGDCFEKWGLTGDLHRHLSELKKEGALAVKPTGSGGGGYVLSLWNCPPPQVWRERLIPCTFPSLNLA